MSSAIKAPSNSRQKQLTSLPAFSSDIQPHFPVETIKKAFLIGCALLVTSGILYFCACDRNEESWCVFKSNAQILSNMGLLADVFR